ncbi:hypothetical protein ACOMHN_013837 [Nucella lapillus]
MAAKSEPETVGQKVSDRVSRNETIESETIDTDGESETIESETIATDGESENIESETIGTDGESETKESDTIATEGDVVKGSPSESRTVDNSGLLYATEEFNTWVHISEFTKGLLADNLLKEQMEEGIQAMEVGCGTGSVMCHLAAMFPKSHFLLTDLVPEGMEHAKNTAKKMNLTNVTFQLLNIFDTTDKLNDSFDWILALDVIHDLPYPQEALERIRKMLKPGGNFSMVDIFMSTYLRQNIGNPTAAVMYALSTLNCIPVSYQKEDSQALGACWGKEQARELVDKAGLRIIDFINTFPEEPGVFGLCMCQKPC